MSIRQIAEKLGVDNHWVYDRIHNGRIKIGKHSEMQAYLFPDTYEVIKLLNQLKNAHVYDVDFREEYQDA